MRTFTSIERSDIYNRSAIQVHVASSDDFGATISSDIDEYSFTPLTLAQATGSTTSNREFGDYLFLTSVGDTFYGVFAGLGDVNAFVAACQKRVRDSGSDTPAVYGAGILWSQAAFPDEAELVPLLEEAAGVTSKPRKRRPRSDQLCLS